MQIRNLKNYPQDGKYLEAYGYDIPVCITKGEDEFPRKRHLWAVTSLQYEGRWGEFLWQYMEKSHCQRFFKTPGKALEFAKKVYKEYLLFELEKLKEVS
jgi:hypothetical protein